MFTFFSKLSACITKWKYSNDLVASLLKFVDETNSNMNFLTSLYHLNLTRKYIFYPSFRLPQFYLFPAFFANICLRNRPPQKYEELLSHKPYVDYIGNLMAKAKIDFPEKTQYVAFFNQYAKRLFNSTYSEWLTVIFTSS